MRAPKLIVSLATAVCAFAVCIAHAQTNNVTFTMTMTTQATLNLATTNIGTATTTNSVLNSAGIVAELGLATSNHFSKTAKLVAIGGNGAAPQFAVSDGTNFVVIATNVMSLNAVDGNSVVSGKVNNNTVPNLSSPTLTDLIIFELDFNDVGMGDGNNLQFSLRGLATLTTSDTTPSKSTGAYTETTSAKISSMTGDGTKGAASTPFVATGSLSASGKESLILSP